MSTEPTLNWPLMKNNITRVDLYIVIEYLSQNDFHRMERSAAPKRHRIKSDAYHSETCTLKGICDFAG